MSKYIYKTIYEEFTGMKPPEPKQNKQNNKNYRRLSGHPYKSKQTNHDKRYLKKKYFHNFQLSNSYQSNNNYSNDYLSGDTELTMAKIRNNSFNTTTNYNLDSIRRINNSRQQNYKSPSMIKKLERRYYKPVNTDQRSIQGEYDC